MLSILGGSFIARLMRNNRILPWLSFMDWRLASSYSDEFLKFQTCCVVLWFSAITVSAIVIIIIYMSQFTQAMTSGMTGHWHWLCREERILGGCPEDVELFLLTINTWLADNSVSQDLARIYTSKWFAGIAPEPDDVFRNQIEPSEK